MTSLGAVPPFTATSPWSPHTPHSDGTGTSVCGTGDLRFSPLLNSDEGQSLNNLLFLGR